MKNFKKIVSLVLAVCLMASLAIGASGPIPLTLRAAQARLPLLCPRLPMAASAATRQLLR